MYFLVEGEIKITPGGVEEAKIVGEKRIHVLKKGDFFGELALLGDVKRTATAAATTVSDINVLSRAGLCETLLDFPDVEQAG